MILTSLILTIAAQAQAVHPSLERMLDNEMTYRKQIVDGILHLQEQNKTEGKKLRGTHSKGVCARANFELFDLERLGLPADKTRRLRQGVFAHGGNYPTLVRFANAASKVDADQAPDVRSVSLAVDLPTSFSNPQGRMDFSFNNATTFPINDSEVFASLMVLAKEGLVSGGWKIGLRKALAVKDAFALGEKQKAPAALPYQKMRYWSGVPFLLGRDEAVKYSVKPCAGNKGGKLTNDPDTLAKELARHLTEDSEMACFEFQVQLLDAGAMTDANGKKQTAKEWVENTSWEWPETQAPFHTIGRVTLEPNSILAADDCERQRFNVNVNTTAEHRGLGSINRARTWAEEESAKNR